MTPIRAGLRGLALGSWIFSGAWIASTTFVLVVGAFSASATKLPWSQVPFDVQKEADHFVNNHPDADTHLEKGETVYHFSGNKNNKHNEVDLSSTGKFIRLEQKLGLNLCPKPIQNAFRQYAAYGKVDEVTRTADTKTSSYEAEFVKNDISTFIEVDKDGKLISSETETDWAKVPAVVQTAIKSELYNAQLNYIGRNVEDKDVSFHIEVLFNGRTNEFWVSDKGRLLERELMFVEVPGAVQKAIGPRMGDSPDVKITKDCEDGPCQYSVEFKGAKDEHTLTVDITGKVISESRSIKLDQAPEPVQKLIKEKTSGATVDSISKTQEGDDLYYEIEVTRDGKDESFDASIDGKVLD
jgi:uncharacterized membrane protein YkoI